MVFVGQSISRFVVEAIGELKFGLRLFVDLFVSRLGSTYSVLKASAAERDSWAVGLLLATAFACS